MSLKLFVPCGVVGGQERTGFVLSAGAWWVVIHVWKGLDEARLHVRFRSPPVEIF